MPSLVLEGGTFRPIFSCGVMDVLLEENIMFPYCIGVSAGISNGISYISKQHKRNFKIGLKYRNDKRYLGVGNIKEQKSLFGLDFIFGQIPNELDPFDWDTYQSYDGKILVGVSNALTAQAEYKDGLKMDKNFTMLRATCALPMFFPAIYLDNTPYFDGGICDPIPIRKAIKDGNKKHLIVLTRTSDYRKESSKSTRMTAHLMRKKYPKLAEAILQRHISYNKTVDFCNQLEKDGKAVVIRPEIPIHSFEKDTEKLEFAYNEGVRLAKERIGEIKQLFL